MICKQYSDLEFLLSELENTYMQDTLNPKRKVMEAVGLGKDIVTRYWFLYEDWIKEYGYASIGDWTKALLEYSKDTQFIAETIQNNGIFHLQSVYAESGMPYDQVPHVIQVTNRGIRATPQNVLDDVPENRWIQICMNIKQGDYFAAKALYEGTDAKEVFEAYKHSITYQFSHTAQ
jgi:hypothetical protein